jgi:dipeptidyl aminopeptidase/acylaminoacyl peptidase
VILFAAGLATGLSRISTAGGEPQPVTTLAGGHQSHRFPAFLPDGEHFLYYAEGPQARDSGVFVGQLQTSESRRVLGAESAAFYAPSGHLLFVRQGTLFAQSFDLRSLETAGEPVALAGSVPSEGSSPAFSISDTGILTYRDALLDQDQQFAWYDRRGRLIETVGAPGIYRGVDLSPDGARIAVHRHDADGGDIWVFEARGTTTRVTLHPTQDNSSPVWSPDGTRIAFGSLRNGKWGVYHKRADETEADVLIVESDLPKIPSTWSPDGKYIAYWLFGDGSVRQWVAPSGTAANAAPPFRLTDTTLFDSHAQVSPDGKWVAYMSASTGRAEVYVRPFPAGEGMWQVSTTGGVLPRWRRRGSELYYVTSYDSGKLMAVAFRDERGAFLPDPPQELFDAGMVTPPHSSTINTYHAFAVSPDGQRFLIPRPVPTVRHDIPDRPITVVLNWTALLTR